MFGMNWKGKLGAVLAMVSGIVKMFNPGHDEAVESIATGITIIADGGFMVGTGLAAWGIREAQGQRVK